VGHVYTRAVVLAGFQHRPGVHCGSTALSDALRVRGLDLSEAMAFGLGAGLGFYYLVGDALSPTHVIQGRQWPLERTACEVLGAPLAERTEDDPDRAWSEVEKALARGLAPILSTDLRFLPYYATRTAFNGHRVVLAGFDRERRVAFLADTEREGLVEVPFDDLEKARASDGQPIGYTGRAWMEIDAPARPPPMREAVARALREQSKHMLLETGGAAGASALDRFAAELPDWPRRAAGEADRAWCLRFAYQSIEKRGTGGGNFRALYARFLDEAAGHHPAVARLGLAERMRGLAGRWTKLALVFKELSDAPGAGVPVAVVELAASLARDERRFYEEVAAFVP
jgi:Domain of unknown function (DUF4872)/Butirosin biosynthesis protein H, N-terminal